MADQCLEFPENRVDNACFYATNVVTTPLLFGLGIVTTFLCIIILNTATIRKANPAFIYLGALATADFVSLLALIPRYIRDSQVLDPDVTYHQIMTYFANACFVVRAILLHASTWYITLATVVFAMRINTEVALKPGFTKISISRIIAFVLCIASSMLNLPRLFEYSVEIVQGHCFEDSIFYDFEVTYLGDSVVYKTLYQWIVLSVAFFTPFATVFITDMVILCRMGIRRLCRVRPCMEEARSDEVRELQLAKSLLILSSMLFLTTIPYTVVLVFDALYGDGDMNAVKWFYEIRVISEALLIVRMLVPGLIYFLSYGDFYKCLCRLLCCTADDYYEPCACAHFMCTGSDDGDDIIDSGVLDRSRAKDNSTLERNARKGTKNNLLGFRRHNGKEFSRWI